MQYNFKAVSNADMIDKVYRNNIIIILGDLYQLIILISNLVYNNIHFNTLSQHKIHLMYANKLCVHKLEASIAYK